MLWAIIYFQVQTGAEMPPQPRVTKTPQEGAHSKSLLQQEILQQAWAKHGVSWDLFFAQEKQGSGREERRSKIGAWWNYSEGWKVLSWLQIVLHTTAVTELQTQILMMAQQPNYVA